jgi:hypothetical protein
MAAILTGIVMLFMCLRTILDMRGRGALVVEASLFVIGTTYFGAAWGAATGRVWVVVMGMLVSPFAGIASLVVLLTGAFAGVMGGAAALITLILLLMNFGAVQKMARARVAMERAERSG